MGRKKDAIIVSLTLPQSRPFLLFVEKIDEKILDEITMKFMGFFTSHHQPPDHQAILRPPPWS